MPNTNAFFDMVDAAIKDGLPEVYKGSLNGFLYDLYPGTLPWGADDYMKSLDAIEADPRLPKMRKAFVERFGEDFWSEEDVAKLRANDF